MFAIGDSLREARTRRGLSAADVQKGIRIRERYLTALEEEHWDLLPGEAYTKGFLRTYAEFLGLDGTLYIDEFTERVAAEAAQARQPARARDRRRRRARVRRLRRRCVAPELVARRARRRRGGRNAEARC